MSSPRTAESIQRPPNVVVLGAGGILGEAWMNGIVAGLAARGVDLTGARTYVGTSAGSIVAAQLASGRLPAVNLLDEEPDPAPLPRPDQHAVGAIIGEATRWKLARGRIASVALAAAAPAGARLRALLLRRIRDGRESLEELGGRVERSGATFDGRLIVAAVDRARGRRVLFGSPAAPRASVARAVQASCAIPGVYRPVSIDGREYVDGGVWSPTNLDAAPLTRGEAVLCLTPTGQAGGGLRSRRGVLRAYGRSALALETAIAHSRGASVDVVAPDAEASAAMGDELMDAGPKDDVHAAGYRQGSLLAA